MTTNPLVPSHLAKNQFGNISLSTLNTDIECIEINHQCCHAKVSLYGGQVLSWQPLLANQTHDQQPKEVFWLSKDAIYQQGSAIRGGIPLCWPWFGSFMVNGKNVGNHGFARQRNWQLSESKITAQGVYLTLTFESKQCHSHWPYTFKLTQKLFFGEKFKQTLTIQNNSEQAFEYSAALHSYFCVSSPANIQIPALANTSFDDKLTATSSNGETNVSSKGPVDRIYQSNKKMRIIDKHWQRAINIECNNTQQWVLWNPGDEIAKTMADIHTNGESEYVCLEAANTQWQTVAARSETSIAQTIYINDCL